MTTHKVIVGRQAALFGYTSGLTLGWLYRMVANRVLAALPPGGRVLDIGTGPGRLLLELAGRRPDADVVGIDPSGDMVTMAARHAATAGVSGRATVEQASAETLPFPDATFDAVVSSLSAHHWADVSAAVAEQVRVLRPGGNLWVFDLRRSRAAVSQALAESLGPDATAHPSLGMLRGALLTCHCAVKRPALTSG
jgi:ubiquinone/menaquinone biosynthesis C-methylase UbiE